MFIKKLLSYWSVQIDYMILFPFEGFHPLIKSNEQLQVLHIAINLR